MLRLQTLSTQHQRLCWLISQADGFDANQLELRAHWARYICVLSSGFLENALKEVYARYARNSSNPAVANYVELALNKIQNPKAGRFLETATSFNKDWEKDLIEFMESDGKKEAIDAIMSNRHLIAHGKDSGITLARISDYLAKSVKVIEFIENQCGLQRQ